MCVCVCTHAHVLMDHQSCILWGGSWTAQSFSVPPQLSHTSTLSAPLISSHSLALCLYTTTGQADGSSSAHRARKSMWIKGYTQQVWRAASIIAVRQRGAPAHLPSRLWDIWLGFCGMMSVPPPTPAPATTAGTVPKGEAGVCSVFQLSNETNERVFVCLVDCVAVPVCICALFWSKRMGSGDAVYLYHWMWWLVRATHVVGKVKIKSRWSTIFWNVFSRFLKKKKKKKTFTKVSYFKPCKSILRKCWPRLRRSWRDCQVRQPVDVDRNRHVTVEGLTMQPVSNLSLIPSQYVSPCLL